MNLHISIALNNVFKRIFYFLVYDKVIQYITLKSPKVKLSDFLMLYISDALFDRKYQTYI